MKQLLPPLAGLLVATAALLAQTSDITLWVTLGDSDQLVEVDPYSYRERRRIKVDPKPHGLAISADGSTVYVVSDKTGNVQVVDARSGRITAQIPNRQRPKSDDAHQGRPVRLRADPR